MSHFIRLDKIKATAHIETVVHTEELKNGQFVELGVSHEDLGGEAVAIEKTEVGKAPEAIVTTVHLDYGNTDYNPLELVTKAGKAGRAHIIEKGNMISFLKEMAVGVAVGNDVTVGTGGFGIKVAEDGEEVIGKVIREDYMANVGDLLVVRFK